MEEEIVEVDGCEMVTESNEDATSEEWTVTLVAARVLDNICSVVDKALVVVIPFSQLHLWPEL